MKRINNGNNDSKDFSVSGVSQEEAAEWVRVMTEGVYADSPLNDDDGSNAFNGFIVEENKLYLAGYLFQPDNAPLVRDQIDDVERGTDLILPLLNGFDLFNEEDFPGFDNPVDPESNEAFEALVKGNIFGAFGWNDVNITEAFLYIDLNNDDAENPEIKIDLDISPKLKVTGNNNGLKVKPENPIDPDAKKLFVSTDGGFTLDSSDDSDFWTVEQGYATSDEVDGPAWTGGYYAKIEELPVGEHAIRFGGLIELDINDPEDDFVIDTTAIINVVDAIA